MRLLHEIANFQTVESKVIISLFETVRLSVSISLRNLYNSLNSIKESDLLYLDLYSILHLIFGTSFYPNYGINHCEQLNTNTKGYCDGRISNA